MLQYIDLHTHSTASDGTLSPQELVRYAYSKNVRALSLTDHDTVAGLPEAIVEGISLGVEIIPGVELNSSFNLTPKGLCHILGYYVDFTDIHFLDTLKSKEQSRKERALAMVEKLNRHGINITFEDVAKCASSGINIGRPHIARAMFNAGYVKSMNEAFDNHIGKGLYAYVASSKYTAKQSIETILGAGGIPVLAHPLSMGLSREDTEIEIRRLKSFGLKGIETYYSTHSKSDVQFLRNIAARNGLLVTCGSDFHGKGVFSIDLAHGLNDNLLITDMEIINKLKRA